MKIKSKSIHIYTSDPDVLERELDAELKALEDYQIIAITEQKEGRQYHYTVFYKTDTENLDNYEIWKKERERLGLD